ncbi:MAG: YCF48-related protein [Opitutaceae bacterium]|nr:YCF48-related protein [Opitutaceae bacterium]
MRFAAAVLLLCTVAFGGAGGTRPLSAFNLFLGLTRAGDSVIAVGDRGSIVRSLDDGRTWTPVPSPTQATLCGVAFVDQERGWACGHEGSLLETRDAGATWTLRGGVLEPEASALTLHNTGSQLVLAGAFGLLAVSNDKGDTWTVLPPPEGGPHIYSALPIDTGWLLAGEMGFLAELDGGSALRVIGVDAPSLHVLLQLPSGSRLAAGLRGHALLGTDTGWEPFSLDSSQLAAAGVALVDNQVILAGQSGFWRVSTDGGQTFKEKPAPVGITGVAAMLPCGDGSLIVAGEFGLRRLTREEVSP